MLILRMLVVSAMVSALLGTLTACNRGGASHVLPPSAGASSKGGTSGAVRKARTINEAAYPNAVILDSPLAFYRLDDANSTLTDFGPNGLNGSYGSAVVHSAGSLVPNTIDPAAQFPGGAWTANAIATVAHNTTLQPANLSIEAWVSEQTANSSGFVDLVSYGPQNSGQAYSLQLSPTNTISAYVAATNSPGYSQLVGSTVLTPGSAYHIVMTYSGTSPKIYINGVLETGTAYGATTGGAVSYAGVGTTYGLSIGAGQSTSRTIFNGSVDDVSLYGAGLTSTQVSAHYAAAQASPDDPYAQLVMSDLPVAYYRLDDAGKTMYDATNHRVNGAYGSGVTKRVTGLVSNTTDTAAAFPGGTWSASSIATVAQNTLLQPTAVTVESWAKETAANSGGTLDLVSYGPEAGAAYTLQITASNTFAFTVRSTGSPATLTVTGVTALTAGTAYHVAATFDGETAKLYVNGALDASAVGTGNVSYASIGTYGLAIGATQATTRKVFGGTLDEVAVYDHALTGPQITAHDTVSGYTASQAGPAHIQTWAYYDYSYNFGVALQTMLRNVDWVEASDPYPTVPAYLNAFKAAGGMHGVWYGDPGITYYCNAPFGPTNLNTPGSCSGAISGYTTEADFLHGATTTNYGDGGGYTPNYAGARLHTENSTGVLYGEKLNPGAAQTQSLYAAYTNNQVSSAPRLDAVMMDDSGPYYRASDFTFNFGTTSSEYNSLGGAAYTRDTVTLACASKRPVIFNGPSYDPTDAANTTTADSAMYKSRCVAGGLIEGAFVTSGYRKSLNYGAPWNTFLAAADKALQAQSFGKLAVLLNEASCSYGSGCYDATGDRIYGLAGIWLVYDPRYTVAWSHITQSDDPFMRDGDGNSDTLVAEYGIVPTQPRTSATGSHVATLQSTNGHTMSGGPPGGPFKREFAQCYQNGASIGYCAVVLNPEDPGYTSGGVVSMPTLTQTYTHSLVLSDAPLDQGGTATWTGSVPTTLQPKTAVILKQ